MECPHCGAEMSSLGVNRLQLGRATFLGGMWDNVFAGSLEVEIMLCRMCGRLEFFAVRPQEYEEPELVQIPCPKCGEPHDFDDAKCPFCGQRLLWYEVKVEIKKV